MNIFDRRIGRIGFAVGYLLLLLVGFALFRDVPNKGMNVDPKRALEAIALIGAAMCLTAWRCHDFGESAWSNFWTEQVPIIGPLLALWDLLTKPGDPDHNGYGPAPRF